MSNLDLKEIQNVAATEAARAVQSAASRWWSIEDIALQMRYSESHVRNEIITNPTFPAKVPKSKQPRYVAKEVIAWFEG